MYTHLLFIIAAYNIVVSTSTQCAFNQISNFNPAFANSTGSGLQGIMNSASHAFATLCQLCSPHSCMQAEVLGIVTLRHNALCGLLATELGRPSRRERGQSSGGASGGGGSGGGAGGSSIDMRLNMLATWVEDQVCICVCVFCAWGVRVCVGVLVCMCRWKLCRHSRCMWYIGAHEHTHTHTNCDTHTHTHCDTHTHPHA